MICKHEWTWNSTGGVVFGLICWKCGERLNMEQIRANATLILEAVKAADTEPKE